MLFYVQFLFVFDIWEGGCILYSGEGIGSEPHPPKQPEAIQKHNASGTNNFIDAMYGNGHR